MSIRNILFCVKAKFFLNGDYREKCFETPYCAVKELSEMKLSIDQISEVDFVYCDGVSEKVDLRVIADLMTSLYCYKDKIS